jgi:hypothetical protein
VTDGELALDLQPHHEKEDRQQAVIDPMLQRHPEAGVAECEA